MRSVPNARSGTRLIRSLSLALWRCDEASGSVLDESTSARILDTGGSPGAAEGLYTQSGAVGSRSFSVSPIYQPSAGGIHATLQAEWSATMWVRSTNNGVLLEYGHTRTGGDGNASLGIWRNGGQLFCYHDRTVAGVSTGVLAASGFSLQNAVVHFVGIAFEDDPDNTGRKRYRFHVGNMNTRVWSTSTVNNLEPPDGGVNGRFTMGGGWDAGGIAGGFSFSGRLDDVHVLSKALPEAYFRAVCRAGASSWDATTLFGREGATTRYRASVEDGDGAMRDLSTLYGSSFVQDISVQEDADSPPTAKINLRRERDRFSLAPLVQDSPLNRNGSDAFDPMLNLRRRVDVEAAVVPSGFSPAGWDYAPVFSGYIDNISFPSDVISIECSDLSAPLMDTQIRDPKAYNYAVSEPVQDHLVTVLTDFAPAELDGTAIGYKGGTPTLLVRGNPSWNLRYVDQAAERVFEALRRFPAEIGWDLRHKWNDVEHRFDLTLYEPPRSRTLTIAHVDDVGGALTRVRTTTPHGLVRGQEIAIAGTTSFNLSDKAVFAIIDDTTFDVESVVTAAAETTGTVTYEEHFAFRSSTSAVTLGGEILSFDDVSLSVEEIRNRVTVRYARDQEEKSLGDIASIDDTGAGGTVVITFDDVHRLRVGDEVTVSGCSTASFNGDYIVAEIVSTNTIRTDQIVAGAAATDGTATSLHYTYDEVVVEDAASIAAYGLMDALVLESTTSEINTRTEATRLANALVSDLSTPDAQWAVTTRFKPFVDLHDIVKITDIPQLRTSTSLYAAVTGVEHSLTPSGCTTKLNLRGDKKPVGLRRRGIGMLADVPFTPPSRPDLGIANIGADILPGVRDVEIRWNPFRGPGDRRYDRSEIHLSPLRDIASVAKVSGQIDATFTSAHGFRVGDSVAFSNTTSFNGNWIVASLPSSTRAVFTSAPSGSPATETRGYGSNRDFVPSTATLTQTTRNHRARVLADPDSGDELLGNATRAVKIAHRDIFGGLSPFSAPLTTTPKFGLPMPAIIAKLSADVPGYIKSTKIPFDAVDIDQLSLLNSDGSIFLPVTGIYSVVIEAKIDGGGSGVDSPVALLINNAEVRRSALFLKDGANVVHATLPTQILAAAGDALSANVVLTDGTLKAGINTYLAVTLVSQTA